MEFVSASASFFCVSGSHIWMFAKVFSSTTQTCLGNISRWNSKDATGQLSVFYFWLKFNEVVLKTRENYHILILDFTRYVCHKTNSDKRFVYYDFASVYCAKPWATVVEINRKPGDSAMHWRCCQLHSTRSIDFGQWDTGAPLSWHHEIIDVNLAICENLWQMTQLIGFCRASTLVRRLRYESTVYALWQYVRSLVLSPNNVTSSLVVKKVCRQPEVATSGVRWQRWGNSWARVAGCSWDGLELSEKNGDRTEEKSC